MGPQTLRQDLGARILREDPGTWTLDEDLGEISRNLLPGRNLVPAFLDKCRDI